MICAHEKQRRFLRSPRHWFSKLLIKRLLYPPLRAGRALGLITCEVKRVTTSALTECKYTFFPSKMQEQRFPVAAGNDGIIDTGNDIEKKFVSLHSN